ncbi:hypothetical protein [Domibacillus robiginosus]|uniref:hypothetical protein n=1 Tax=Domibacillus robiginosus TaxID=1071054 RepID=UPI000A4D0027|nr:hypothetical protein [Domibacillus robiginosus]
MEIAKEIVLMTKEIVTILSMIFTTFFAFKTYQNNMKKASRKKKSSKRRKQYSSR